MELEEDAKFLVLCTDGIFEFMGNEDILRYVEQKAHIGWLPSDIAKGLVHIFFFVHTPEQQTHIIKHFISRPLKKYHRAQQDIVTIVSREYHQLLHEVLPVSLCREVL